MIRFGVLGGRLGPAPWQVLVAVGLASFGAAALLYVLGSSVLYPWLLGVEEAVLLLAGAVLTSVGWVRRRRGSRASSRA